MGFKLKLLKVEITEGEYAGLVAQFRRLTMRQLLEISDLAEKVGDDEATGSEEMVRRLADGLHSWNLEDDAGQPVSTDYQTVLDLPADLLLELVQQWTSVAGGTSADLGKDSSAGEPSRVASLPMDQL